MRDAIKDELQAFFKKSRQRDGLTLRKLVDSCVLDLPMVQREMERTGTSGPKAAMAVIKAGIASLGSGIRTRALANALNVDGTGADSLTVRRQVFGGEHKLSPDTIENYENDALEDLVEIFLDTADHFSAADISAPSTSDTADLPAWLWDNPYYHWRVTRLESTYAFVNGRSPSRFEVVRHIVALRETDQYVIRFKWTGGSDPPPSIDSGGEIVGKLGSSVAGFIMYLVDLKRVFSPDDPHVVRYHMSLDGHPEPLPFVSFTPSRPVESFLQRLTFGDEIPSRIYKVIAPFPDFPHAAHILERVFVDSGRGLEFEFENLVEGLAYGFAWEW